MEIQQNSHAQPEIITLNLDEVEDNPLSANEEDTSTFSKLQDYQKEYGLLEIPVVRKLENGKYRIVGGHHKLRSWRSLGNQQMLAILLHKKMLSPEEESNLVNFLNRIKKAIMEQPE